MARSIIGLIVIVLTLLFSVITSQDIPITSTTASTENQNTVNEKGKTNTTPIEHVIVLMMENRSLDHLLGYLKNVNKDFDGCVANAPRCSNPVDPKDPNSEIITVDDTAVYVQVSPSHSIGGTTTQLYGSNNANINITSPNNGFIKSYTSVMGSVDQGKAIMKQFSTDHVPVLSTLAQEYAVFDGWFASVPGPTMPNRAFLGSATSHGMGVNDKDTIARGMTQKTMFRQLLEMGLDYRLYFEIVPAMMMFKDMRHVDARRRFHGIKQLYTDLESGDLPEYTFIEPAYYATPNRPADDQHPDHDVGFGEQLIQKIYDAVRASPIWNTTAFIITYDEHGGFFDHVAPEPVIPSPDGYNYTDADGKVLFDFTRIGVRVPTVIVSPWVKKGSVIHAPAAGTPQYEHSSMISTIVHKMFRPSLGFPKPSYLNARDEWAATFEHIFTRVHEPRTDCLEKAPAPVFQSQLAPESLPQLDGSALLNDLQIELLAIVAGVVEDDTYSEEKVAKWTEFQAAQYAADKLNAYFGRIVVDI